MIGGQSIIVGRPADARGAVFYARNPRTGDLLEPGFESAQRQDVDRAAEAAAAAFREFSRLPGAEPIPFFGTRSIYRFVRPVAYQSTQADAPLRGFGGHGA